MSVQGQQKTTHIQWEDRFVRTIKLLGHDTALRLKNARVTVVGLGAVGSYVVEGLSRAGVGRLRLVDFDTVHPSNINRQLYALESTVGRLKTEVAFQRVKDINPECEVEILKCFAHVNTLDEVLGGPPDLVVDAIDSLNPKVELIIAATSRGIPLVSSMGAALRTNPTLIRVGPFSEITTCHLAKMVRRRLRKRKANMEFQCVYSIEPMAKCVVDPEEMSASDTVGSGRPRRVLGSLPTLTGIFGLTAAQAAINLLLSPDRNG